jgi:hypothetical protein
MVLSVPTNTYNALLNAAEKGIVPRDFVWIRALNTVTEGIEEIGVWNGNVPVTVNVIRPDTGATVSRVYQGLAGLMQVPSIPMSMKLEVRSIRLAFSNLSPELINAVLVYNTKSQPIEIHRGLLDPSTMNLVDPALCRFDGLINKAPFKRAKAGNDGQFTLECQSHARTLAMGNPEKLSDEFFKRRGGRMPYMDVIAHIVWGQKDKVHERRRSGRSRWID